MRLRRTLEGTQRGSDISRTIRTIRLYTLTPPSKTIITKVTLILLISLLLVNRQCEYEEYKAIMVAGFLAECKNPYFMWKNKFGADFLEDPGNDNLTPDVFVTSDWFEMEMRQ